MQPPPYSLHSSTSGFQTSDLYPGTSTSVSSHPSVSIDAFPMSSVPELIDQRRGSHTASSVLEDQNPVQDQMNVIGNPFSGIVFNIHPFLNWTLDLSIVLDFVEGGIIAA